MENIFGKPKYDTNILVKCREEMENFGFCEEKHIIISIYSDNDTPADIKKLDTCVDILAIQFADIDLGTIEKYPQAKIKYTIFNEEKAKQIIEFVNKYKDIKTIYVHCDAGISRSPAVAAALSLKINGNDYEFFKKYIPNRLVYRIMLNELFK